MVHILLWIIKVIGIVLAAVLGLILFLFFIVLLGPIGYEAVGQAEETRKAEGRISWLWFVIRYKIHYDSQNEIWWKLRVFGIPILSSEKQRKKKADNQKKKAAEREKESPGNEAVERQKNFSKETLPVEKEAVPQNGDLEATAYGGKDKTLKEIPEMRDLEATAYEKEEKNAAADKKELDALKIKESSDQRKKQRKPSLIWRRISEKIKNIRNKIKEIPQKLLRLRDRGKEVLERFQEIREYFLGERNKEVLKGILTVLKKMLRHILPNQLRGRVEFGLEDPYRMGQVLALLGVLMPIYQDKLEVHPDFEEEKLKGDLSCKGRIIPGYLLFYLLKLFLDRDVRRVVKEGKALIGGK